MIQLLVIALLAVIVISLGSAMLHLLREPHGSTRTVRALTWRVGLSLALFVLLMLAYLAGFIQPHGLGG